MRPLPRLAEAVELIDSQGIPDTEIEESLRDLERLNRRFGGVSTVVTNLERMAGKKPRSSLAVLDVATGAADIPRALCRWAGRRRLPIEIEALDQSGQILRAAQEWSQNYPEIRFREAKVPPLPYPDKSFDYVITSLFLHHLTRPKCVDLLREMKRVARRGLVANDLMRSRTARIATRIATRILSSNRLTRHDGPMSVERGFTQSELLSMAKEAGLGGVRLSSHLWFRIALVEEFPERQRLK